MSPVLQLAFEQRGDFHGGAPYLAVVVAGSLRRFPVATKATTSPGSRRSAALFAARVASC